MKCVICKHGEVANGKVTVTLEKGSLTLVIKSVPARVCSNCGEEYLGEDTTQYLYQMADEALQSGVQVDIREYVAA